MSVSASVRNATLTNGCATVFALQLQKRHIIHPRAHLKVKNMTMARVRAQMESV